MAAQDMSVNVTIKKWVLNDITAVYGFVDDMFDLGLVARLSRLPAAPAEQQIQLQVDIPDRPNTPVLVSSFGDVVVMLGGNQASLERLTAEEFATRYPA